MIPVDKNKLRHDLKDAAAKCKAVKRVLRRRWERPMAEEQQQLHRLKRHATELCVLMAHSRGKRHLQRTPVWWSCKWTEETHAKIAERVALAYGVALEETG